MADLIRTAANVAFTDDAAVTFQKVVYGEAVTQGDPIYLNASDGFYYQADADSTSATAEAAGVAMLPGAAGDSGIMATAGGIDVGATLAVGETYVVSATAGQIAPIGDLSTGDYTTILGVAETASKLVLSIYASGVVKP